MNSTLSKTVLLLAKLLSAKLLKEKCTSFSKNIFLSAKDSTSLTQTNTSGLYSACNTLTTCTPEKVLQGHHGKSEFLIVLGDAQYVGSTQHFFNSITISQYDNLSADYMISFDLY
jgi:hypothetical protein